MAFLSLSAYGLWLAVKLRPLGFHNLLPTGVALVAAVAFGGVAADASRECWEIAAMTSTLLAWTLAGLFDLARLVRSLPRHAAQEFGHET